MSTFISLLISFLITVTSVLSADSRPDSRTQYPGNAGRGQFLDFIYPFCDHVFSPFQDSDRQSFRLLKKRLVGRYGEYRRSYKPGHLHAGIDLQGRYSEEVYAVGRGRVTHIFRTYPNKTVIIKHFLRDAGSFYSVYTHLEDIHVNLGDRVDERTPLARLFTEKELLDAKFGTANHVHLEIRKSMEDEGSASYSSMTLDELNKFCLDPLEFFRKKMRQGD